MSTATIKIHNKKEMPCVNFVFNHVKANPAITQNQIFTALCEHFGESITKSLLTRTLSNLYQSRAFSRKTIKIGSAHPFIYSASVDEIQVEVQEVIIRKPIPAWDYMKFINKCFKPYGVICA